MYLGMGIFLFIIPGWSLLSFWGDAWKQKSFLVKLGLSAGLSLSIYPLLFLWLGLFKIQLNLLLVILPGLFGIVGILIVNYRNIQDQFFQIRLILQNKSFTLKDFLGYIRTIFLLKNDVTNRTNNIINLLTFSIVFFVVASRINNLRFIDMPMWGDSLQHAVMAQLFIENHGMFQTWFPYAPYVSFTVQYGFSSLVSIFMWLMRLDSPSSTLIVGQLVNIMAVLSIFPITYQLTGNNKYASIAAVMIAGLISPLPGGYINWGRYAQLTGLAILPVSIYLIIDLQRSLIDKIFVTRTTLQMIKPELGKVILLAVVLTGMFLSYYRLFLFIGAFIVSFLIIIIFNYKQMNKVTLIQFIALLLIVFVIAGILVLPWLVNVKGGSLADKVEIGVTGQSPTLDHFIAEYQVWKEILTYVPFGLIVLFLLGLIWSVIRRNWDILGIGLWTLFLSMLVLFKYLRIPTAYFAQNFSVIISLYIPISIVGGWFLIEIIRKSRILRRKQPVVLSIIMIFFSILVSWGTIKQSTIADPEFYALVTQQDLRALKFIKNNVPEDSLFLVEAMSIPPGDSIVGNDAGWWLPLLSKRSNLVPPQYAHLNEIPAEPGFNQRIVNLVRTLEEEPIPSTNAIQILCDEGITHAYIGQKEGKVSFGNKPLFTEAQINESNSFTLLYELDQIRIYQFDRSICSQE
jgi:hypothetical protein